MKIKLTIELALLSLFVVHAVAEDCSLFESSMQKYNWEYRDEAQRSARRQIFCENVEKLEEERKNNPDANIGVTKFSDRTKEEIRTMNGYENEPESTPVSQLPARRVGAPLALNWVKKKIITSVKDQGQCGSCWAFASAACFESREINKKQQQLSFDVSEQYILQCTTGNSCSGGYTDRAMKTATGGLPLENQYPYQPSIKYNGICDEADLIQGAQSRNYYMNVADTSLINFLQEDPIVVSACSEGWVNYVSGIYSCQSNCVINHAVLVVGYDEDYWLIKNSWGSNWGDNGYIKVTRTAGSNCKVGERVYVLWSSNIRYWLFLGLFAMFLL